MWPLFCGAFMDTQILMQILASREKVCISKVENFWGTWVKVASKHLEVKLRLKVYKKLSGNYSFLPLL